MPVRVRVGARKVKGGMEPEYRNAADSHAKMGTGYRIIGNEGAKRPSQAGATGEPSAAWAASRARITDATMCS